MNSLFGEYQEGKYKSKIIESINNFKHNGNDEKIKIFHVKIRSAVRNFDELLILLEKFPLKFDITVLAETFQMSNIEIFKINGYQSLYNEGSFNRYDGLFVYPKIPNYAHKMI